MFAARVHQTIWHKVLHGADPSQANYEGNKAVGDFLKARVFAPIRTLNWDVLTRHATGESLNPKVFAADFQRR